MKRIAATVAALLLCLTADARPPQVVLPRPPAVVLPAAAPEIKFDLKGLKQPTVPFSEKPNSGSCQCNRTGGECHCSPASKCAAGRCDAATPPPVQTGGYDPSMFVQPARPFYGTVPQQ